MEDEIFFTLKVTKVLQQQLDKSIFYFIFYVFAWGRSILFYMLDTSVNIWQQFL